MTDDHGLLKATEAAAMLGIARSTFYLIPFFRKRAIYVRPRCPRWAPADVRLYMSLNTKEHAA